MTSAVDTAYYRNRGGLLQRVVSRYKLARYVTASGRGNLIKHNAVVTADVPPSTVVGGVPARIINSRK